jgi:hypothetical protein
MMYGFGGGTARTLPTLSGPVLVIFGLLSTLLWFLITTFTQTLNLTVYSGAYQHLAGISPAAPIGVAPVPLEPGPVLSVAPSPAPDVALSPEPADERPLVTPVEPRADDRPVVPPPEAPEDEVPPTL